MAKIVITGHTGFVGQAVLGLATKNHFNVLGLSRTEGYDLAELNSLDFLDNEELLGIIHLAANADLNACEMNPTESYKINVKASALLAYYAFKRKLPFIFASTDQVFDGERGAYGPKDEANPLNEYGRQKLEAEKLILSIKPSAVVCRLPLMIGEHGGYEKAFVEDLKAGKQQRLFTDEIRSVAEVNNIAKSLLEALAWQGGIYHLGGPKALNRYELALILAKKYGLDQALLSPAKQADVVMLARRPKDVSMVR